MDAICTADLTHQLYHAGRIMALDVADQTFGLGSSAALYFHRDDIRPLGDMEELNFRFAASVSPVTRRK